MTNYKLFFTIITLGLCFAAHANGDDSTLTIANIGPQDAYVIPVVITTTLKPDNFSTDSFANLLYRISVIKVEADVYKFVKNYLIQHKRNVDTLALFDYGSVAGSCSIFQSDENGKHYYLLAYKAEAISYLKDLVYQLKNSNMLKEQDVALLIGNLKAFIQYTDR